MKKVSKSVKIRKELLAGHKPAEIAKMLKVPVNYVYTENWKMKNEKQSKKKQMGIKAMPKFVPKEDLAVNFLREELANIEQKIDDLNTIAAFLAVRLRQMEQNA